MPLRGGFISAAPLPFARVAAPRSGKPKPTQEREASSCRPAPQTCCESGNITSVEDQDVEEDYEEGMVME